MKLYQCEIETTVYCLANSQHEAMAVARDHYRDEEPDITAYEATFVEGEWHDARPHHRHLDVPDRTCAEWLKELNGTEPG